MELTVDIQALADGNEQAFELLVQQTRNLLMSVAFGLLLNREEAADAVQEAYLRIWKARRRLKMDGNVTGYLVTTVRNVALNQLRKSRPEEPLGEEQAGGTVDRDRQLALEDVMDKAMRILNEGDRLVVALIHYRGMDSREVGRVLALSDSTVRGRYQAARTRMRNFIIRNFPEFAR